MTRLRSGGGQRLRVPSRGVKHIYLFINLLHTKRIPGPLDSVLSLYWQKIPVVRFTFNFYFWPLTKQKH